MRRLENRDINAFLGLMVFSSVGNVCADFALLWYGLSLLNPGDNTLTYFYIGQAVGVIALSPAMAVFFDRLPRFVSSVALDVSYAALLIVMAALFRSDSLTPPLIFIFSMLTAALSILHKSSVGFAAVQKLSEISGVTDIVARFVASLNIPYLVGSALSGVLYHWIGFEGCMAVGVATFLPMPFLYWRVFAGEAPPERNPGQGFFDDFRSGIETLRKDPLLYGTALSVSTLNIASAVLPAIVGFSFLQRFPGRTDYASLALSASMLTGILLTKKIGNAAQPLPVRLIVPLSILPAGAALLACLWIRDPFLVAAMFMLSCLGSAARNVSSGSLRVSRVPKALIGRVNTVYTSLLHGGQLIGGFVIVKAVQNDFSVAVVSILACFVGASAVSLVLLPRTPLSEVLKPAR